MLSGFLSHQQSHSSTLLTNRTLASVSSYSNRKWINEVLKKTVCLSVCVSVCVFVCVSLCVCLYLSVCGVHIAACSAQRSIWYIFFSCSQFSKKNHLLLLYACVRVCAPRVCSVFGGQKRASHPLDLELQTALSCHVGVEKQTQVLWSNSESY